jgi:hypothetical protein
MIQSDSGGATRRFRRASRADRRALTEATVEGDEQAVLGAGGRKDGCVVAATETLTDYRVDVMTDLREDLTGAHRKVLVELDPHSWVGSRGMISSRASIAA